MASIKENNLELNYGWLYGESRWNSGMDENIVKLGFESRKRINGILSSPPSSPSNGDAYLVGTTPTGLFSGKFANIAIYDRGSWVFITPKSQEVVFNTSDGCDYIYNNGWSLKLEAEVSPYIKIKDFTFSTGYTITDQRQCLLNLADNKYYQWNGTLPKVVSAGSTPATAGGIGVGAWVDRTDVTLRLALAGEYGASMVGSNDAGGYWYGSTVEAQLQEAGALLVNIRSMGADITGVTASDAAMAAALALSRYVIIPAGCKIALDTMLTPAKGTVIWMGPGAELFRRSAADSTDPIIWMRYSNIVIHGSGASSRIRSEKACPNGLIRIGSESMTTPIGNDMFMCSVKSLSIEGAFANELTGEYGQISGNPDIGILINAPQIDSSSATSIGIQASYFHNFTDLTILKLNYGITHRGYANGIRGSDIHFERLGSTGVRGRALDFNGGGENCYVNIWHHYSRHSDGIYARSPTFNSIVYGVIGNCIANFVSEPGNAGSAKMYDIKGEGFQISGLNYCTTPPTIVGTHTINVVSPSHSSGADITWTAGGYRHTATDPAQIPFTIYGAPSQGTPFFAIRNSANAVQLKAEADGSFQVLSGFYPGIASAPGVFWKSGAGTPEGVVTAPVGSMWTRTTGGLVQLYISKKAETAVLGGLQNDPYYKSPG